MHPIFKISGRISPIFRGKRIQRFLQMFDPGPRTRVLEVGGLPRSWEGVPIEFQMTILNTTDLEDHESAFLTSSMNFVIGDGTKMPWADGEFDIVFSNSVIEHLGTAEAQAAFARECRRVGKAYWIQTPAREFPIEPHYFGPCVHWFSRPVQKRLLRNFTLWGLLGRPREEILDLVLAELRLLRRAEFESLFPDGQIWTERLLGLPKSYTAYRLNRTTNNHAVIVEELRSAKTGAPA